VGWKTGVTTGKCSTLITFSNEANEVIAQKNSRDCESTPDRDDVDKEFEWLNRTVLPTNGTEAPITVRVSVIPDGKEPLLGERTIILRNPNNYR